MILSTEVKVTISNQGKYFASLGYGYLKQGTQISVPLEDLPKNSNIKVECQCDECSHVWWATYQSVNRQEINRCLPCNRKYVGKINGSTEHMRKIGSRNKGVDHPRWKLNKNKLVEYSYKVRRITEENYREHKDLINPDNYPRTLCGVDGGYQLDHRISMKWAFEHGLNPKIAGSIENLQMLSWKENLSKSYK